MRTKLLALAFPFLLHKLVACQVVEDRFEYKKSAGIFVLYSNDSSHIILGTAENRKLAGIGLSYTRRLVGNNWVEWAYEFELRPVNFLRDPIVSSVQTTVIPGSGNQVSVFNGPRYADCVSGTFPVASAPGITSSITQVCGSRWTYAGGLSPLGQRISFAKRKHIQPFAIANAGFLVSTRDIPANESSRFNFTFEGGAGVEWFENHRSSWSVDYRLHHLSNHYLGAQNPGVDSQVYRLSYRFGH